MHLLLIAILSGCEAAETPEAREKRREAALKISGNSTLMIELKRCDQNVENRVEMNEESGRILSPCAQTNIGVVQTKTIHSFAGGEKITFDDGEWIPNSFRYENGKYSGSHEWSDTYSRFSTEAPWFNNDGVSSRYCKVKKVTLHGELTLKSAGIGTLIEKGEWFCVASCGMTLREGTSCRNHAKILLAT